MRSKNSKIKNQKYNFKIKSLKLFSLTFTFCLLTFAFAFETKAQNLSIGVYPPILQIQADPPAQVNSQITIQNLSDQNTSYQISFAPFKAGDSKNGQPVFEENLNPIYRDLFTQIQISEKDKIITEVSLGPKEKKDLKIDINIPENQDLGDYYFSVIFSSNNSTEKNDSSFTGVRGGVASNILLSIGPETTPQGQILEFSAPKFVTSGPVIFKLNTANTGKNYINVKGNVKITNMFGQVMGNINTIPANILAESQRYLSSSENKDASNPGVMYKEEFLMGIYTAEAKIALSENGPILTKSLTFFAFPWEAIIAVTLLIIFSVVIIKRVKRKSEEQS